MLTLTNLQDAEPIQGEYLQKFSPATLFIQERREYYYELPNGADSLVINGRQQSPLISGRNTFRICIEGSLGLTEIQPTKAGKSYGQPIWVEVYSYKFPTPKAHQDFYQAIVGDLFQKAANLPFRFESDARRGVSESLHPPTPLFTYFFLQQNLGIFQSAIETILAEPYRLLCDYSDQVCLHDVSEVDSDVILSILHSPDTWVEADAADLPITNALRVAEHRFAPSLVWQRLPVETFDTRENRFILNFLRQVLITSEMLPTKSWWRLVKDLKEAKLILELTSLLRETIAHPMFSEVGEMHHIPLNSQVLLRREGYQDLFFLWQQFHHSARMLFDEWQWAMDMRSMHHLYEIWAFFEIVQEIGGNAKIIIHSSDEEGLVNEYTKAKFDDGGILYYNKTHHPRYNEPFRSYSMVLRPDYVWIGPKNRQVVLDAKFSMVVEEKRFIQGTDISGEEDEVSVVREENPVREDLYKMHTYRDALVGTNAAVIIYPGTVNVFMSRNNRERKYDCTLDDILTGNFEGIGALCRKPGVD